MELYHLHLKGCHDDKWKERKEIVVTNKFENRLFKKVNNNIQSINPIGSVDTFEVHVNNQYNKEFNLLERIMYIF